METSHLIFVKKGFLKSLSINMLGSQYSKKRMIIKFPQTLIFKS